MFSRDSSRSGVVCGLPKLNSGAGSKGSIRYEIKHVAKHDYPERPLGAEESLHPPLSSFFATYTETAGCIPILPILERDCCLAITNLFVFKRMHTLLSFFAVNQNSTPLFSSNSELFAQNTRGWTGVFAFQTRVSFWDCSFRPIAANLPQCNNGPGVGRRPGNISALPGV
jgi:hypothetical protein